MVNPVIQQIVKLFEQLSDDERLHVLDEIEDKYGLIGFERPSMGSEPVNGANTIHVRVTKGAIENHYLSLGRNLDFFPEDVVSLSSAIGEAERTVRLHVFGYSDPIDTDIIRDKGIFRGRVWRDFYRQSKIKPNQFVVIERLSDYEYKVYPLM